MKPVVGAEDCDVCGHQTVSNRHEVVDHIHRLGKTFTYTECGSCGSLSLRNPPADLHRYYPDDYYSFATTADPSSPSAIRGLGLKLLLGHRHVAGLATRMARMAGVKIEPWVELMGGLGLGTTSAILDVGCGSGHRLHTLHRFGFRALTGIDAFLPDHLLSEGSTDGDSGNGPRLMRSTVTEVAHAGGGPFDLVMFHHSLEHMAHPADVLNDTRRLLSPRGAVIVRLPVTANLAWKRYGLDWVQIDAPRHQFVPSERGLVALAERCGLKARRIVYDSSAFQFWGSELNRLEVSLSEVDSQGRPPTQSIPPEKLKSLEKQANRLNAKADGDQAGFLLVKPVAR